MENQVAISEDEREKIMKEHEKDMAKLESRYDTQKYRDKPFCYFHVFAETNYFFNF